MSQTVNVPQELREAARQAVPLSSPDQLNCLLETFVAQALQGTVVWRKNVVETLTAAIRRLDALLSQQLAEVMHHDTFQALEGTFRGLHYLVREAAGSPHLRIKVLNLPKPELQRDLGRAVDGEQTEFFKKIYESEFGLPGGEPYGLLIGDYAFTHHADDIALLRQIASVAAVAFCPFVSSAGAGFLGLESWSALSGPRELAPLFESADYAPWRQFRESDEARFVALTLPRVLARAPYGRAWHRVEAFDYEEAVRMSSDHCWTNAAYMLGARVAAAFAQSGWTLAMRGAEGGGKVMRLPMHFALTDDGDVDAQCPTEVGITDRREAELSQLGFLPLCHYRDTDYAVFFGGQTVQKARVYDTPEATANARISTRLPYLLATSRFAHYLKVMARDKIGSFLDRADCEQWLNHWIQRYVNANRRTNQELKSKYPLAEARIEVSEIPGRPGAYHATAWLRPWLQFEELTASLRLVAQIPGRGE